MSDEEYSEVSDISSMESSDDDDNLELLLNERRIKNQNYLGKVVFLYILKVSNVFVLIFR